MNIGKSLTFPFQDKNWLRKMGGYVLVLLVPILNLSGVGYSVEVLRRAMKADTKALPGWDHLGRKFLDGLALFFVGVVYMLPIIVLGFLPLSLTILPDVFSGARSAQGVIEALRATSGLVFAGVGCVFGLYVLAFSLIVPAIYILYGQTGRLSACFSLRRIFSLIGRDSAAYFTAYGVALGVSLGVSFLVGIVAGMIGWLPVIGQLVALVLGFFGSAYASLVFAHLFGQVGGAMRFESPRSARKASR